MRREFLPVAFAVCAWLAACSDGTGPDVSRVSAERVELGAIGEDIHILHQSANAPWLETYEKSMEACYGQPSQLRVRYMVEDDADGEDDDDDNGGSGMFLRLEVPSRGLWKQADGASFGPGDCVLITVSIDPEYLLAEFHPGGLQFDPANPATLTLSYSKADPDLDGDGKVDESDEVIEREKLGVFRLPHDDGHWEQVTALHIIGGKRLKAPLYSFSHYAVAH